MVTTKNMCLMILNDKPNCQVSRILMNPRPIFSDRSENDPKLKLNVQKTKYMVITFKKKYSCGSFNVRIGDNDLECLKHMKYLGVVIDDKLKFYNNTEILQKKISRKINFIRRLSSKLCKYSKFKLYKAIILPHLDYCSSLFLANNLMS
jgi:hypothetical protein